METDKLGLYVHIPYCKRKCNYCDFCSFPSGSGGVPSEYVNRLTDEIFAYKGVCKSIVHTVYFGGGTPSLLTPAQMNGIMLAIREVFQLSDTAEITMEANPGTLTAEKAMACKAAGFNRISLGVQSIHENELKKLGRIHTYEDFINSYRMLRNAGFENINVDLMYGIPHQTKESFKQTLDEIASLSPEHISCYGLIVEKGTPFYNEIESLPVPTLDDECDMYYMASDVLADNGYSHYEISNYAKPGFESKHNLLYWNTDSYIGVGASAHSYYNGIRRFNTSDADKYVMAHGLSFEDEITPDLEDRRYEYAMLALRLKDGFSLSEYEAKFGNSFTSGKDKTIEKFSELGLLRVADGRISLTEQGFYVSNSILVEIL